MLNTFNDSLSSDAIFDIEELIEKAFNEENFNNIIENPDAKITINDTSISKFINDMPNRKDVLDRQIKEAEERKQELMDTIRDLKIQAQNEASEIKTKALLEAEKIKKAAKNEVSIADSNLQSDVTFLQNEKEKAMQEYSEKIKELALSYEKHKNQYEEKVSTMQQNCKKMVSDSKKEFYIKIREIENEGNKQLKLKTETFNQEKEKMGELYIKQFELLKQNFEEQLAQKSTRYQSILEEKEKHFEYGNKEVDEKLDSLKSYYENEKERIKGQYIAIIQSEKEHYQTMINDLKAKRVNQANKYEDQMMDLKEHYEPLIHSGKEYYKATLTSMIKSKEELIKQNEGLILTYQQALGQLASSTDNQRENTN